MNRELHNKVSAEQLRLLNRHIPWSVPFHILLAALVAGVVWQHVPLSATLPWLVLQLGTALFRLEMARRFNHRSVEERDGQSEFRTFLIGVGFTGLLWGSGYVVFSAFLSTNYQILLTLVLGGIVCAGILSSYGVWRIFIILCSLVLGPPLVYGVTQDTSIQFWMSMLIVLFIVTISVGFSRFALAIQELIGLRFENDRLVQWLASSNRDLEFANEQLATMSHIDNLTNVANRRYFDGQLRLEWARAQRSGSELSYLMIDIDYFKLYNDKYGHVKGDETLRLVAATISQELHRPGDLLGRYGGEEFAVLSPETPSDGAVLIAENIRDRVAATRVPNEDSPTVPFVTVSIGVATLHPDSDSLESELIKAADEALYQAKREGRNRVCVYHHAEFASNDG